MRANFTLALTARNQAQGIDDLDRKDAGHPQTKRRARLVAPESDVGGLVPA